MSPETICARCGDEYELDYGKEPSKYCNDCAQIVVDELSAQLFAATEYAEKVHDIVEEARRLMWRLASVQEGHPAYEFLVMGLPLAKAIAAYDIPLSGIPVREKCIKCGVNDAGPGVTVCDACFDEMFPGRPESGSEGFQPEDRVYRNLADAAGVARPDAVEPKEGEP